MRRASAAGSLLEGFDILSMDPMSIERDEKATSPLARSEGQHIDATVRGCDG